jgi:hypothetical protein
VTIGRAPAYPCVLDELAPSARRITSSTSITPSKPIMADSSPAATDAQSETVRRTQGNGGDQDLSALKGGNDGGQLLVRVADADPPQGAMITM